jgi:L-malate glycosyltransferase
LKVVIAYNYDPSNPNGGGGITYVHNLIKYLLDKNYEVILFGVKLSERDTFTHPKFKFIPVLEGSDNWFKFLFYLLSSINSTKLSNQYVIHTHHPLVMWPFIKALPKNPKICTFHGIPMDWVKVNYSFIYSFIEPFYLRLERKVIKNVDIITTAGDYPLLGLMKRYPDLDLKDKSVMIPSGVDLNKFKLLDKIELKKKYGLDKYDTIIIFLGRLSEQKNLKFLLKSYSIAKSLLKNSVLVIVGQGELEHEIKEFVEENEIRDVIFTGSVRSEEVPELLNCADLLALTSRYEASPTVVKEALSCGVPVITTNVGDVSRILNNCLLGRVVDKNDERVFADYLIQMTNMTKLKPCEIRHMCREVALKNFTFDKIGDIFFLLYLSLV